MKLTLHRLFLLVTLFILVPFFHSTATETVFDQATPPLIRKLTISGHYPYLTRRILRMVTLQPGDPLDEFKLEESRVRIAEFFEKAGHYGTKVMLTLSADPRPGFVNLHLDVDKGITYRIGEIYIEGNTVFKDRRLENKLTGFGHFSIKRLTKRLKSIEHLYSKKGYVRARAKIVEMHFNEETRRVDLFLAVDENKKLHLKFQGNSWFKPQTLDDFTVFKKERGYSSYDIERSREKLILFYKLNGFNDVTVVPSVEKNDKDIFITFNIHEGVRARIKKIVIDGNKEISDKKLKKSLVIEEHTLTSQGIYRDDALDENRILLETALQKEGFFEATADEPYTTPNVFGDLVTVTFPITEGARYTVSDLVFEGVTAFRDKRLLKRGDIKVGKPYNEEDVQKTITKLRSLYFRAGYPYARIEMNPQPNADLKTLVMVVKIYEGVKAKIGSIEVIGNYDTKEKVIREALQFKTGDIYTYDDILNAQLNLKRLGIFDYVLISPMGLDEENEVVDVIVKVVERKPLTVDVQAGFDSDKLASGQLIVTKRNLFGLGKQIQFRAVGGFEFDRGEITFYSPRIFGANWNLVNQYFLQYEDRENYNGTSFGGSLGVLKNYGADWTLLLKTQIVRFNLFEDQSNNKALEDNLFDSTFYENLASLSYDTRDNFADPRRGVSALATTEFDLNLADPTNAFNKSQLSISHFLGFSDRLTLINTFRGGKIWRIGEDTRIPAPKLFFMGGNDTVRGFDEDAISASGGTTSLIYNLELQYRIMGNIKVAGFFDAGALTETFDEIDRNTIREAAGVGLRYVTPVGPIRLDYGFVLDKKDNEPGQRFHFSFGYFF